MTPAEMAEADRRAIAAGTPESVLIGRAAAAVARHAMRMLGGTYGRRVVVAAGKGNNGADGRDAADRLRRRGVGVDVFAVADEFDRDEFVRALKRACTSSSTRCSGPASAARSPMRPHGSPRRCRSGARGRSRSTSLRVSTARPVRSQGPRSRADETITFVARKPGLLFEPGRGARRARHRRRHRHRARPRAASFVPEVGDLRLPRRGRDRAQVVVGLDGVRWIERPDRRAVDGRACRRTRGRGDGRVQLARTRSRGRRVAAPRS